MSDTINPASILHACKKKDFPAEIHNFSPYFDSKRIYLSQMLIQDVSNTI